MVYDLILAKKSQATLPLRRLFLSLLIKIEDS